MANNKKQVKILKQLVQQEGLGGGYGDLIRQAVLNDWSTGQFLTSLVHSDNFRTQYPGLMQGGDLAPFLTGQTNAAITTTNLAKAISNYGTLWNSYQQAAKQFADVAGHIGKDRLATLIKQQVSPDEFRQKLQAVRTVSQNPEAFRIWEQQARLAGHPNFNPFEAALGTSQQHFYDIYEAARLRELGQGLGFSPQEAQRVAKNIPDTNAQGQFTGPQDIGTLISQLRGQIGDIGPELQAAGISTPMLASFIANPSNDPNGIAAKVQQIIATRRSAGGFVPGTQAQRGAAGGLSLFADQPTAAY